MTISERDKVVVCRHCKRADLDGLDHGRGFDVGGPDFPEAEIVCLWPCGHAAIPDEPWCSCQRPQDEAPF